MNLKITYKGGILLLMSALMLIQTSSSSVKRSDFSNVGLDYLQSKYPSENVTLISKNLYTQSVTGEGYTLLKTMHGNKREKIVVRHSDHKVGSVDMIHNDYTRYVTSLAEPYPKISDITRWHIKKRYGNLPSKKEADNLDNLGKLSVILIANNTIDLVKIAKEVNSKVGFPRVWNGYSIKHVSIEMPINTLLEIASMPEVKSVWYDSDFVLSLDDSVPAVNGNYFHNNLSINGSNAIVAVVDTGVDSTHPDLDSNIDHKSFYGSTNDTHGHGTGVAGVIGSRNSTYRGMAYGATIVDDKIYYYGDSNWTKLTASATEAIDWAISKQDADIIQMSMALKDPDFATDASHDLSQFIDRVVYADNTLVVLPTGNYNPTLNPNTKVLVPADSYNSLSVGRTTADFSKVHSESGHGLTSDNRVKVDVVAPGTSITTTNDDWEGENSDFVLWSGTSFAAPHVSGLAALLYDYAKTNDVPIDPLKIKAVILNSARKIKNSSGGDWWHNETVPMDPEQGAGMIDAQEAYDTFIEKGRLVSGTITGEDAEYYYVNISDAPVNLTVTLVWNRHVTSSSTPPISDLGLYLYNETASGFNYSDGSDSWFDNVEHLFYEIPAGGEGIYEIEVYAWNESVENYAIASSHRMESRFIQDLVEGWNLISLPVDMDE